MTSPSLGPGQPANTCGIELQLTFCCRELGAACGIGAELSKEISFLLYRLDTALCGVRTAKIKERKALKVWSRTPGGHHSLPYQLWTPGTDRVPDGDIQEYVVVNLEKD